MTIVGLINKRAIDVEEDGEEALRKIRREGRTICLTDPDDPNAVEKA